MNDIAIVLLAARALIADKNNWTNHALARDSDGHRCGPSDQEAQRWCAAGAIYFATTNKVLQTRALEAFKIDVTELNDYYGHKAVLNAIDEALCKLDSEGFTL
jgi:hypothetical protein